MNGIYCLMVNGGTLSDVARETLYRAACLMLKEEKRERKILHDDFAGVVFTDFDTACLGTLAGTVFEANVETEKFAQQVKFLVTDADWKAAKNLKWYKVKVVQEED